MYNLCFRFFCSCCLPQLTVRECGAISIKRRRGITNSTWRKREMFPCVLTITDPIPNFHRFLHFLGHGCSKRLESDNEWKFQCTLEHSLGWFNWLVAVCRHFNINIALIRFPSVVVGGERNPRFSFLRPSTHPRSNWRNEINKQNMQPYAPHFFSSVCTTCCRRCCWILRAIFE